MQDVEVSMPSERRFGLFFSAIFVAAGLFYYFSAETRIAINLIGISGIFLFAALLVPALLRPLNFLWFKFGLLLGKIISPIVLGVIFFLIITPIALLMRLFGRDELQLKNTNPQSHWNERKPVGPDAESFKNQF